MNTLQYHYFKGWESLGKLHLLGCKYLVYVVDKIIFDFVFNITVGLDDPFAGYKAGHWADVSLLLNCQQILKSRDPQEEVMVCRQCKVPLKEH